MTPEEKRKMLSLLDEGRYIGLRSYIENAMPEESTNVPITGCDCPDCMPEESEPYISFYSQLELDEYICSTMIKETEGHENQIAKGKIEEFCEDNPRYKLNDWSTVYTIEKIFDWLDKEEK